MEGFPLEPEVRHRPVVSCNAPQRLPFQSQSGAEKISDWSFSRWIYDYSDLKSQSSSCKDNYCFCPTEFGPAKNFALKKSLFQRGNKERTGTQNQTKEQRKQTDKSPDDKCFTSFSRRAPQTKNVKECRKRRGEVQPFQSTVDFPPGKQSNASWATLYGRLLRCIWSGCCGLIDRS